LAPLIRFRGAIGVQAVMKLSEQTADRLLVFFARAVHFASTQRKAHPDDEQAQARASHLDATAAELVELVEQEDREFGKALRRAYDRPAEVVAKYSARQTKVKQL